MEPPSSEDCPDTTDNKHINNVCSNCCESLISEDIPNTSAAVYELKQDSELIKVGIIIERIFKLGHLRDEFFNEEIPLCPSCARILCGLYAQYEEFLSVQHLQSYISKQIEKLDEIIRRSVSVVEIQSEVEVDFDCVENTSPCFSSSEGDIKGEEKEKKVQVTGTEVEKKVAVTGPWVVLQRLRPRQIPANVIAPKHDQSREHVEGVNYEQDEDVFEGLDSMSEYSDEGTLSLSDGDYSEGETRRKNCPKKSNLKRNEAGPSSKRRVTTEDGSGKKSSSKKRKTGKEFSGLKENPQKITANKTGRGFYREFYRRKQVHPFPCVYCELDFDQELDRVNHLKEKHWEPGKVICTKCGKVFCNSQAKKQHEPKCGAIPTNFHLPPYICKSCGKEFKTWFYMASHEKLVHTGERRFPCDQCDYTAKLGSTLREHKKLVHEVHERVQCPECNKTFKSKLTYDWHFKNIHTEEGYQQYRKYQRKTLDKKKEMTKERQAQVTSFCTLCNIDFQTVQRFRYHFNEVHETKKWQCEQCGKGFVKAEILRVHVRNAHSDARPYVCEQCGKSYKSLKHLRSHVFGVHTEEGRRKNNEYHRENRKQRAKLAEQLAKKQCEQTTTFTFDPNESEQCGPGDERNYEEIMG